MGALDGRVAVITGAGRGLGREHALCFARQGARVVVNDVGTDLDGTGRDTSAAQSVVDEIHDLGGVAVRNGDDVSEWDGGRRLIDAAVEAFGSLDVLVNNAGILRDRALVNMTAEDWDAVVNVHLRGHFAPTRWAATYWRSRVKEGVEVRANVIHTSSTSGLFGNPGQTNYGAAKAGIAAFSMICAQELARYGVRSNCIVPGARTRMTETTPGLADVIQPPEKGKGFDVWDPANVSPLVAFLATADCPFTGCTFFVRGGMVKRMEPWRLGEGVERDERWTVEELIEAFPCPPDPGGPSSA